MSGFFPRRFRIWTKNLPSVARHCPRKHHVNAGTTTDVKPNLNQLGLPLRAGAADFPWQSDEQRQMTSLTFFPIKGRLMKALTQYGRNGRETLARTLPENGERTGGAGTVARDVAGGRGEDEGRNDRTDAAVQKQGLTAQQAHDRAWEMVRENYILLPAET